MSNGAVTIHNLCMFIYIICNIYIGQNSAVQQTVGDVYVDILLFNRNNNIYNRVTVV